MAAAANGDAISAPIWSATTNWIAAEGSLRDSISFDTSENIEDDQVCKPLILLRPDGDDPPPCEITIYFKEKHEIHRVYVRSTARVYEIYYSSDHLGGNEEYLCTVRCGAAMEEVTPESSNGYQRSNNGNSEITGHVVRSGSNSSDEDGWVQVKSPDSLLQDDKEYFVPKKCDSERDSPKIQIHYEATAEISDYNPCFSITLRMLSIQTKNSVHVEEIYVYADPVESCDPDPPVTMGQNSGASSMFAMLIPSLMQLSKSATSRDKSFSDEARVPNHPCRPEKLEHTMSSTENSVVEEMSFEKPPAKKWSPDKDQAEAKAVKFEGTSPQQMPGSLADQHNNQAYTRIEKALDDLVLKVGRVEAFCSMFEVNMLKPFDCMEKRLQQLEQKLDALAAKSQSSVQCHCSKVASSESNEYNSNSEDGSIKHIDQIEGSSIKYTEQRDDTTFIITPTPAVDIEPSVLEPQTTHPGLIIKAPEFLTEDDEYSNTDGNLDPLMEDIPKDKKSSSIDSALASSLAAFLTSTAVKSPNSNPGMTELSRESINSDTSALDLLATVRSDGAANLSDKSAIDDYGCDFPDAAGKGLIVAKFSSNVDSRGCGKQDAGTECTDFDDSLSGTNADDELPPAFASESSSGFEVMPLEFPNRYDFNCDDNLGSSELDCLEDPPLIARFRETVLPLAEFPSFTAVRSPESTQFNAPSMSSIIDNNELSVSNVEVPIDEADVLGVDNQEENEIEDEVFLGPTLSMSHPEASFEQEDHALFKLNGGVSQNFHGEDGIDDNDAEKSVLHGFDPHNKGCTEDSNIISSNIHDNRINQMLDTEWSVGGGSGSSIEISAVTDDSKLQAATNNYECGKASEGHSWPWESPNKEEEDVICNVKFSSDGNWMGGLPLELLLSEMLDAKPREASTSDGDGDGIDIEHKLSSNSSSSPGADLVADTEESFLPEVMPDSSFETEVLLK